MNKTKVATENKHSSLYKNSLVDKMFHVKQLKNAPKYVINRYKGKKIYQIYDI